jgi:hypothetical protein
MENIKASEVVSLGARYASAVSLDVLLSVVLVGSGIGVGSGAGAGSEALRTLQTPR